jgi:ABC-type phosphate transport system permease subunit
MSAHPPYPRRPPRATFQPRFTIGLLYVVAFFLLYSLLLAAPALFEVANALPPGPEQQEAASRAAKEAVQSRLWMAGVAALVTTAIGIRAGVLPGTRGPR